MPPLKFVSRGTCHAQWEYLGVPEDVIGSRLEVHYTLTIPGGRMLLTRREVVMWLEFSGLFEWVGSTIITYKREGNITRDFVIFKAEKLGR